MTAGPKWLGRPAIERRAQVLAAARDEFAESGFHRADVQAIARATGIGKATIYKIFGSKDGILQAMLEDTAEHLATIVLAELVGVDAPSDRLREGALRALRFAEENKTLCTVLLRDGVPTLQHAGQTYREFQDRMEQVMAPLFAAERARGRFRGISDRLALEIVMSLLLGRTYKWLLVQGGEGDLMGEGKVAIELLLGTHSAREQEP